MKKFFSSVLIFFLVGMSTILAEPQLIEAEGFAVMGDGPSENPAVAKERARSAAKRAASEKAGIYISSLTEVKESQLVQDEIKAITADILEVVSDSITSEVWADGPAIKFICHIKAVVNADSLIAKIQKENEDRQKFFEAVQRQKEIEADNEKINQELENLKTLYKETADAEQKEKINLEVKRNEEKFTAVQLNAKGVEFYNKDEYDKAIDAFNQAIETDKNYAAPLNGLGWVYHSTKDYEKAAEFFNKALAIDSNFASALNGLAWIENYNRHFDKAIEYCEKALAIDENYSALWNNLGYAHDELGDFNKALECYEKALAIDKKDANTWNNIGSTYDELGNYDKAIEYCTKATEIAPKDANAWNNLGYAYSHKGDFDKAIECFNKAVQLNQKFAVAWNGLGYAYNFKKNYSKAASCCKKAVEIDPNYANAWNGLGYAYGGLGKVKDSINAYQKAVELAPEVEMYRKNLEHAQERASGKIQELFKDKK